MFPLGDVAALRRHIDRVAATGCTAMCVTVDFGVLGIRDGYLERRWQPDISHFLGSFPAEQHPYAIALLEQMSRIPERSWSWDDLGSLFADASLPFFVKGVLTAADARRAVEVGARAVIVSNHGGRQLDGVPATLDQLGEVVEAVGELVPVGIDGGIRRGRDVVVALARGASVVLVGRLIALALASAGEAGVRRALRLLHEELLTIMMLTGRQSIADIDETLLQRVEPY
jgi:isopentenyl diphosphate isomerase/L-lactate dehydrogenase-like FMN-dependent dehydrogenase